MSQLDTLSEIRRLEGFPKDTSEGTFAQLLCQICAKSSSLIKLTHFAKTKMKGLTSVQNSKTFWKKEVSDKF